MNTHPDHQAAPGEWDPWDPAHYFRSSGIYTEPGTLDLSERLPSYDRETAARQRAQCDTAGHLPVTYNPIHNGGSTFCGCGLVTYPGDHGRLPVPRIIASRGKFDRPV